MNGYDLILPSDHYFTSSFEGKAGKFEDEAENSRDAFEKLKDDESKVTEMLGAGILFSLLLALPDYWLKEKFWFASMTAEF